jgi:hypothetical protein
MSLDDGRDDIVCPVVLVAEERRKVSCSTNVYRVSWNVNGVRKEEFFASRVWAEKYVNMLLDAAQLIRIDIDPLIGDVPVANEPA